jgi:hypothetical protein
LAAAYSSLRKWRDLYEAIGPRPFMLRLTLPDSVTAFGGVQALWWLVAAITLIVRGGKIANLVGEKDMAVS